MSDRLRPYLDELNTKDMVHQTRATVLAAVTKALHEHRSVRVAFPNGAGIVISPIPPPSKSKIRGQHAHLVVVDEVTDEPT